MQIVFNKNNSSFVPKNFLPRVLKSASVAVICVNSDLKVKFVNESCEKLLKYTSRQLIGKKLGQLFENNPLNPSQPPLIKGGEKNSPPDKGQTEQSEGVRLLDKGGELEGVILDSNNNKIPVAISIKKIEGVSKPPIGFILIITDLSETKKYYQTLEEKTLEINQKNESLKELQKELEIEKNSIEEKAKKLAGDFKKEHATLLASVNDLSLCFLITDNYNNIILKNKAAKNIFPFLNGEKIITVTELQNSARMTLDLNIQIKKVMNEKQYVNITDVQIDSKFINIFISPIILKLPQPNGGKSLDVRQSELKSALGGLDSQQNLDTIGVAMIIEDQTKQHELERSKEDLFNIASHELRTPLTAIYGYTALIKQMYFGKIQNEELKIIINNIGILSKKLSLSVSNFLDSSKLEQGKIELKIDQYDLFSLINESIKEMEVMALWKNLYIKFDPPASPVMVTADRIRITQILNILINNAIKFTRIGGIYISVETNVKSDSIGLNFAKIIIKDTGTGITDENKKLLFHKFQRAGENLLTREEGTGLGLHLAKLLIEKMGGTITLEKTEINKGSAFSFTVPICR